MTPEQFDALIAAMEGIQVMIGIATFGICGMLFSMGYLNRK